MTEAQTVGPIAVPQQQTADAVVPQSGIGSAPPSHLTPTSDPALEGFTKIAAEQRDRRGQAPVPVPFGTITLRIHRTMPALFIADLIEATANPAKALGAMRSVIVSEDLSEFERILQLPPDNEHCIDGEFLLAFIKQLSAFYGAVPLDD